MAAMDLRALPLQLLRRDSSGGQYGDSKGETSASQFLSTLIPTLVVSGAMFLAFAILQMMDKRQYFPRTFLGTLRPQERTPPPPRGLFGWVRPLFRMSDMFVLRHHSLDAYLMLRYVKISCAICFVGCWITWPILFPVNATGGGGMVQLNLLTFGNVSGPRMARYFAHCFVSWVFVAFVFFMITRELIYFINLRQAYLLSPLYAARVSSKTVLFTSVPEEYRSETALRRMYGDDKVKYVWTITNTAELEDLVNQRNDAASKLESAEIALIKKANKARSKALKKAAGDDEQGAVSETVNEDGESGSAASRWLKPKDRPTHRLKFLIGKKVDTIDWCREEIPRLTDKIEELQAKHKEIKNPSELVSSVFVEFHNQTDAQAAYQMLAHNQPLHMSPRYIGAVPSDIIWSNLRIKWWELILRNIATLAFVVTLIVFWTVPVAFVGSLSNITSLENKAHFLRFINHIPSVIRGVVTGLLPSVLLGILMALLPIVLRLMAKWGGVPTTAAVELRTQNFYFAFQVVQVFFVATFTSAATSVGTQIAENPSSAATLLAQNLPRASNLYISYFVVQGLSFTSGAMLQITALILGKILGKLLDNSPRKMYMRWASLGGMGWGTVVPPMSLLIMIAITYATIAPLVLGFSTVGLYLFYLAFRYNLLYVNNADIDTKGAMYPRALQHATVGIYLLLFCEIGLFAIGTASNRISVGPLILMVIFTVFTIMYHISLNSAVAPLLEYLPKNLDPVEEELQMQDSEDTVNYAEVYDAEKGVQLTSAHTSTKNAIYKFFNPHKATDYASLRKLVPRDFADIHYTDEVESHAYYNPAVTASLPLLWIPRDEAGVSKQEVAHSSKAIPITDDDAYMDPNGKISWSAPDDRPPIYSEKQFF